MPNLLMTYNYARGDIYQLFVLAVRVYQFLFGIDDLLKEAQEPHF